MSRSYRPVWQRYGAALIVSGAALALKLLLLPLVSHDEPALLFFAAVIISAAFGGLGPGLLATAVGALCDEYFFMAPYRTWHLNSPAEAFRLGVFVLEAVFISLICARMKSARQIAESARKLADQNADEARELQRRVLEISDAEQQRLGHDLHDGLGQHLTGIALLARRLQERIGKVAPADAEEASTLTALAQSAVEWTHDLCRTLSPSVRDSTDLPEALLDLAAKTENIFNIKCGFKQSGSAIQTEAATGVHLYRIAQEAISNAVRHGGAANVEVRLENLESGLLLEIADDGTGIEPASQSADGMGMQIMRYRAKMIGASIDIRHREQGGTVVSCRCQSRMNQKAKGENGNE